MISGLLIPLALYALGNSAEVVSSLSFTTPSHLSSNLKDGNIGRFSRSSLKMSTESVPVVDSSNRPFVLIGCSGAGNEIPRLASHLVSTMSGTSGKSKAESVLDEMEGESSVPEDEGRGGVVEVIHQDDNGFFVFTPMDMRKLILGGEGGSSPPLLSSSDVIVLDYGHALFSSESEKYQGQLVTAFNSLAKTLFEELGCVCVYVNVDPVSGVMNPSSVKLSKKWQSSIFVGMSDYEIVVMDEGLDPIARMALKEIGEGAPSPSSSFESAMDSFTMEDYAQFQSKWEHIGWELDRIIARATLPPATPGDEASKLTLGGTDTFFLSLSFPEIDDAAPYMEALCRDNDAMEFRADLLSCRDDRFRVLHSLQRLRQMCRPHATRAPQLALGAGVMEDVLPVVFTVRTKNQAGAWPDQTEGDIQGMFDLLALGLRNGIEVLDVESNWDPSLLDSLLERAKNRYAHSLILGSYHLLKPTTLDHAVTLFHQCTLNNRAHGAKLVLSCNNTDDASMAYDAASQANLDIPSISLVLSEQGQHSRVLNRAFTPTTHSDLPFIAAPGQLSSEELMERRIQSGILKPLRFAILGHGISYSVSPAMQGAAFQACGLPHTYGMADVETVEEFVEDANSLWNSDDFGGMSVTIPHKQAIMKYTDEITQAAESIGSVNTLIVKRDQHNNRRIIGDNTDWKGIYNPLSRRLKGNGDARYALILGGGGTARAAAYAAKQLGLKRLYYNRTPSKADDLVDCFGGKAVSDLTSPQMLGLADTDSLEVVISTLPAAVEFQLPQWISDLNTKPVVFDVNYKPYYTKLLVQAEASGCQVVRGSEMLWEQGVGQFELWLGRTAPYKTMKTVVLENCLPKIEEPVEVEGDVKREGLINMERTSQK